MMSATSFSGLAPREPEHRHRQLYGSSTYEEIFRWMLYRRAVLEFRRYPRRIILMNGHLDAGLMAGWHDCFQKILQIFPQFFFGHRAIRFKKFIQFCHPLRFPSGKCLSVKIFQNIGSHFLIVILYFAFFIIQCSGSVFQRMKKGPFLSSRRSA